MIFIILAAGKGERLKHMTTNLPKPLVPLPDGTTLLDRQLTLAIDSKLFEKIIIVTGFQAQEIEKAIIKWRKSIVIETIFNPDFEQLSPVYSLSCAKPPMLASDFVMTVCDNVYNEELFNTLKSLQADDTVTILASKRSVPIKDDMRLQIDTNSHLVYANKYIDVHKTDIASTNVVVLKGKRLRLLFCNQMDEMMNSPVGTPRFFHHIFNKLVEIHHTVDVKLIPESWWYEVDDLDDYEKARKLMHSFPNAS